MLDFLLVFFKSFLSFFLVFETQLRRKELIQLVLRKYRFQSLLIDQIRNPVIPSLHFLQIFLILHFERHLTFPTDELLLLFGQLDESLPNLINHLLVHFKRVLLFLLLRQNWFLESLVHFEIYQLLSRLKNPRLVESWICKQYFRRRLFLQGFNLVILRSFKLLAPFLMGFRFGFVWGGVSLFHYCVNTLGHEVLQEVLLLDGNLPVFIDW